MKRLSFVVVAWMAGACSAAVPTAPLTSIVDLQPRAGPPGEPVAVVASTSILADVVSNVGGSQIELTALVPIGTDPHAFEPSPRDVRRVLEADVVFVAGFGLEAFLDDLLRQAAGTAVVVSVSDGIRPIELSAGTPGEGGVDPHTWLDPANVAVWTDNIRDALQALDPDHAAVYAENAETYRADLAALDDEIRQTLAAIPAGRRQLVADHEELGYFARAYGFEVIGTLVPGVSSLAEPSAADLARLIDQVASHGAPAVFVSSVIHPALAEAFAADSGLQLVTLYGHSLTTEQGPAPSYLELMRYNARAIISALSP